MVERDICNRKTVKDIFIRKKNRIYSFDVGFKACVCVCVCVWHRCHGETSGIWLVTHDLTVVSGDERYSCVIHDSQDWSFFTCHCHYDVSRLSLSRVSWHMVSRFIYKTPVILVMTAMVTWDIGISLPIGLIAVICHKKPVTWCDGCQIKHLSLGVTAAICHQTPVTWCDGCHISSNTCYLVLQLSYIIKHLSPGVTAIMSSNTCHLSWQLCHVIKHLSPGGIAVMSSNTCRLV